MNKLHPRFRVGIIVGAMLAAAASVVPAAAQGTGTMQRPGSTAPGWMVPNNWTVQGSQNIMSPQYGPPMQTQRPLAGQPYLGQSTMPARSSSPYNGYSYGNAPAYNNVQTYNNATVYNNRLYGYTPGQSLSPQYPQRVYSAQAPNALNGGDRRIVTGVIPHRIPTPPVGVGVIRITTPTGQRTWNNNPGTGYYGNGGGEYYGGGTTIVEGDGPSVLGGYYYGGYTTVAFSNDSYPSIYSDYSGFPGYIYNPGVVVLGDPYYPSYQTPYLPFYTPTYQVTYNQNNYYVGSEQRAQEIEDGGDTAQQALKNAYPADSFQAAYGDIEKAWTTGDVSLIQKHVRDSDTKLSVYFKGKYSYSIASGDFVDITRDALNRLSTTSFTFDRLRKAKNGDVTAYGKHTYRVAGDSDASSTQTSADGTVPFSTDGAAPYAKSSDPGADAEKTIYTSYTLRHGDDGWYIVGVDTSPDQLVK